MMQKALGCHSVVHHAALYVRVTYGDPHSWILLMLFIGKVEPFWQGCIYLYKQLLINLLTITIYKIRAWKPNSEYLILLKY